MYCNMDQKYDVITDEKEGKLQITNGDVTQLDLTHKRNELRFTMPSQRKNGEI